MTRFQANRIIHSFLGIFAFAMGQLMGFANIGAPDYAKNYFGEWAPIYLVIHIGSFAVAFWSLYTFVGWLAHRKERNKCANT